MKKQKRKQVQNTAAAPITAAAAEGTTTPPKEGEAAKEKEAKQRSFPKPVPKKPAVKKARQDFLPVRYYQVSRQFLKESKLELKKVKWPTRKELLASTAVVIALTLLLSFYLGVVDFGLVKIIKAIVG